MRFTYPDIVLRVLLAGISVWAFTRIAGKRQFAKLTFMEYIMGLIPVSIAGTMTVSDKTEPLKGAFAILAWAMFSNILHRLELKSPGFRGIIAEGPTVVVQNGKILPEKLSKIRFSLPNLLVLLHEQGVFDLAEVEFAVVEPTGQLSILKKSQHQPATPHDLGIPTGYKGLALNLIMDGVIDKGALRKADWTENTLLERLKTAGLSSPGNVFLAALSTDGSLYLAEKEPKPAH